MKNLAIILTVSTAITTGAYAQGVLSADDGNTLPFQRYARTHPAEAARQTLSAEGSVTPNPAIVKPGLDWKDAGAFPVSLLSTTLVKHHLGLLDDAAWEAEHAAPAATTGLDDDSLAQYSHPQSSQPRFAANNFRAWDFYTDSSGVISYDSGAAIAALQALALQDQAAVNANNVDGKTGAAPQQAALEVIDEDGPRRMIISNIASPEPNTIAMAVIGGSAFCWSRLSRRRTMR